MALHGHDKDDIVDYIPECERDSDDPCIIRLKFVPFSKVQHYARLVAAKSKGIKNLEKITEITQTVQRKQFTDNVESVSGYFIGKKEVSDPGEFYETADTDLVIEVIGAMESLGKLTEGQIKNSEPLSATNEPKAAPSTVTPVPTPIESSETAPTVTILKEA